jgi:hypothetical protein
MLETYMAPQGVGSGVALRAVSVVTRVHLISLYYTYEGMA